MAGLLDLQPPPYQPPLSLNQIGAGIKSALGPIWDAGMSLGDQLRTGQFNPAGSVGAVGNLMLGMAGPPGAKGSAPMRAGEAALQAGPIMSFGQRVQSIVNKLEPELGDKVSIGTVYDNYGKDFPDAGSLVSFKQRLVEAGKNRDIELHRSDMVDRFPGGKDERQRSEAKWGDDTVHFVRQK